MNIDWHKRVFISILKEIYEDPILRVVLGFKGGTAAMLFYDLPRFSVDLDFDLLFPSKKEIVFTRLKEILPKFGVLTQATDKKYTLFFLLVYQKGERNLKIEISKRGTLSNYIIKNYLGISMMVMKEEDMAAGKLSALLTRNKFAARDLFDLWFFLKNNWEIDETSLKEKIGLNLNKALNKAKKKVKGVKKTELLSGLGELVDDKQKIWAKEKLPEETIFYLDLYLNQLMFSK